MEHEKDRTNLQIEYVPIEALNEYKHNAKIHTREQIEQIKASIQQFGMCDPIAVWSDNIVIEGHGRLMALRELGEKTVPIIRLEHLTDEERRAYGLVHNMLTMNTGFNDSILNNELESLDIDMTEFGFEMEEEEISFDDTEEEKPEIEFTEVLGEEHNYIVLYFDNDVDWLQAETLFDIGPKLNLSTRKDGKVPANMEWRSVGRVIRGAEALEKIRKTYENID